MKLREVVFDYLIAEIVEIHNEVIQSCTTLRHLPLVRYLTLSKNPHRVSPEIIVQSEINVSEFRPGR